MLTGLISWGLFIIPFIARVPFLQVWILSIIQASLKSWIFIFYQNEFLIKFWFRERRGGGVKSGFVLSHKIKITRYCTLSGLNSFSPKSVHTLDFDCASFCISGCFFWFPNCCLLATCQCNWQLDFGRFVPRRGFYLFFHQVFTQGVFVSNQRVAHIYFKSYLSLCVHLIRTSCVESGLGSKCSTESSHSSF